MTYRVLTMSTPATYRDSTQLRLPCETVAEFRESLNEQFVITVVTGDDGCRIIGSPVEIESVNRFLTRRGVLTQ